MALPNAASDVDATKNVDVEITVPYFTDVETPTDPYLYTVTV